MCQEPLNCVPACLTLLQVTTVLVVLTIDCLRHRLCFFADKLAMSTHTSTLAQQDMLHSRYTIEAPIKTIQDTLYVRISSHIYNTLQDYRVLADAVLELQQHIRRSSNKGRW